MSTIFAPVAEVTCLNNTDNHKSATPITAATPGVQIRPAASFLTPTRMSWINTPFYNVPAKKDQTETLRLNPLQDPEAVSEFAPPAAEFAPEGATEAAAIQTAHDLPVGVAAPGEPSRLLERMAEYAGSTMPLEGFDVNQLAPELLEVARDSHISHVQTVIGFLQKGGDSAKTFGKIFLNDLALQQTVLASLINEPAVNFLHKELALRLAVCSQARQVAQLLLSDI